MNDFCCGSSIPGVSTKCGTVPNQTSSLFIRKNKNGQYQVKHNKGDKWINAKWDACSKTLSYLNVIMHLNTSLDI